MDDLSGGNDAPGFALGRRCLPASLDAPIGVPALDGEGEWRGDVRGVGGVCLGDDLGGVVVVGWWIVVVVGGRR